MTVTITKKGQNIILVGTAQEIVDALVANDNAMPVVGNYNSGDSKWYVLARKGRI